MPACSSTVSPPITNTTVVSGGKHVCTGDSREHKDLEVGLLFSKQKDLPSLPVPDLASTMELWLKMIRPLVETFDEFTTARQAVNEFLNGIGKELQARLIKRAEEEFADSSWLQTWWGQLGYLQPRYPLVININFYAHFATDTGLFAAVSSARRHSGITQLSTQSMAAARILSGVLDVRDQYIAGTLPPDAFRGGALCSIQWKYVFNACRIPKHHQDEVYIYDKTAPGAENLVVLRNNKCYSVPVRKTTGERYSTTELAVMLQSCIVSAGNTFDCNVGILTSDNRDNWATARAQLLADSFEVNEKALEAIQSAIIAVCLDDESPVCSEDVAALIWHGAQSGRNNRWFDKSMQLIVFNNGKSGVLAEHSMFDGSTILSIFSPVLKNLNKPQTKTPEEEEETEEEEFLKDEVDVDVDPATAAVPSSCSSASASSSELPLPQQIKFLLSPSTATAIAESSVNFDAFSGKHDLDVLNFHGFGAEGIKKMKSSPDAFVQVAIQYAYFKLFRKQVATYESSSTKAFRHGRTETTRSCSQESKDWIATMVQKEKFSIENRYNLLQKALSAHSSYTSRGAKGLGIDRHLSGLQMLLQPGERAALFEHPLFERSNHWTLSTSQVTDENFDIIGFGEVYPDGFGIGYEIKPNSIVLSITSCHKQERWCSNLRHCVQEALLEMQALCAANAIFVSESICESASLPVMS